MDLGVPFRNVEADRAGQRHFPARHARKPMAGRDQGLGRPVRPSAPMRGLFTRDILQRASLRAKGRLTVRPARRAFRYSRISGQGMANAWK